MITGFSHVSIVVPDIEAAARTLAERYGLAVGERLVNEQQGVRLAYVELANGQIRSTTSRASGSLSSFPLIFSARSSNSNSTNPNEAE